MRLIAWRLGSIFLALGTAAPAAENADALAHRFAKVFATGDQRKFEQFALAAFDPAILSETPAVAQADYLARLFDDTGGLAVERAIERKDGVIVAEARDAMTNSKQCLKIQISRRGGRPMIRYISVKPIYASGAALMVPTATEVITKLSGIAARYDARGLMSGVLLIAQGDTVLFESAYGFASLAHHDPMMVDTRLNIASIGKVVTGIAIAQLVDAGKLTYADRASAYLPPNVSPAIGRQVTIRQLLSHTSGLGPRDYYEYPEWDSARPLLRSVGDYLELIRKERIGVGAPPGKYLYSNAGFVLLGAVIEQISGESFYDYVERHIFKPAGMATALYAEADAEIARVAEPLTNLYSVGANSYRYRRGQPRKAIYELAARGGPQGGVTLTARELWRLDRALQSGRLISAARLAEMQTPTSPSGAGASGLSGDVREGLGIEVVRQNGHLFYGHTGGDLGVAASAYRYPDQDITVIVLTNRDPRAGRVLTSYSRALLTRNVINGAAQPRQSCEQTN